ncbi:LacI family DNA-binding transcriptional regulator, partial [Lonepinella koalarum]
GVSVATVSRVLNNHTSVKESNRQKVLNAIEKLNYQPNLLARQLRTARSGMLLVMVSNIANPFCAAVVKGIEFEAEKNGYRILLSNTESDLARSRSCLKLLSGKIVDGVITMDAISTLPELQSIIGDFPWVQCAEYDPNSSISSVSIDNLAATEFIIDQLVIRHKKRIAMINHDLSYQYAQHREQGYYNRLRHHHLSYQKICYAEKLSLLDGRKAALSLLQDPDNMPDAIFAISDVLAIGAIYAVQEMKLKVPEDVAIIGFDGVDFGQITTPALTTIQQPCQQIGEIAVKTLLQQIESPNDYKTQHYLLDWKFIQRESS